MRIRKVFIKGVPLPECRHNKKGFVFTLDAMFAIIIAFVASFALITMFSANVARGNVGQLAVIGNDILSVLYYNSTFNSYIGAQEAYVNADISAKLSMLPQNFCGNLSVTVYDADNFDNKKQYGAATCSSKNNDVYKSKRLFTDYNRKKFGTAEVEIWLR